MLWKGLLLGFSIAAPVGPIGLLCIRRTLAYGRVAGLVTGLGAAAADCVYGLAAAFGLTAVSATLMSHEMWIRVVGGLFLIYLGIGAFLSSPTSAAEAPQGRGLLLSFGSTFLLTIANPMTVLSFLAFFASLGLASVRSGYGESALLVAGVFTGSAIWWFLLSGAASLLRSRFTPKRMSWVNRFSGVLITGFGIASILRR